MDATMWSYYNIQTIQTWPKNENGKKNQQNQCWLINYLIKNQKQDYSKGLKENVYGEAR